MSRGLGRIEQAVLTWLRDRQEPYTWLSAVQDALCPPWPAEPAPTQKLNEARAFWAIRQYLASLPVLARREAMNRAVRSGRDLYGRRHRKAVWLADRPGPSVLKGGIYSR